MIGVRIGWRNKEYRLKKGKVKETENEVSEKKNVPETESEVSEKG